MGKQFKTHNKNGRPLCAACGSNTRKPTAAVCGRCARENRKPTYAPAVAPARGGDDDRRPAAAPGYKDALCRHGGRVCRVVWAGTTSRGDRMAMVWAVWYDSEGREVGHGEKEWVELDSLDIVEHPPHPLDAVVDRKLADPDA